jgi:hypothetical protein
MSYRANKKARKLWSEQANAKKARLRLETAGDAGLVVEVDHRIKITIERPGTREYVVIECSEGDRIDNYSVYVNGDYQGVQSISTLTKNLRKALPRFRRMD